MEGIANCALGIYMWCRGALETTHDHIYETFVKDQIAQYFITLQKRTENKLKKDGLKRRGKVVGTHARGKGNMTFHIFSKINQQKSFLIDDMLPTVSSMQVEHAFIFGGRFHNLNKKLKVEVMNELIKRAGEIKE